MWDGIWPKPNSATHSIRYEIRWQSLGESNPSFLVENQMS